MTEAEFQASGLLWLANRALHPFGVALAVAVHDGTEGPAGEVVEGHLSVIETDDPMGYTFSEADEDECRAKFFRWLRWRHPAVADSRPTAPTALAAGLRTRADRCPWPTTCPPGRCEGSCCAG